MKIVVLSENMNDGTPAFYSEQLNFGFKFPYKENSKSVAKSVDIKEYIQSVMKTYHKF